MSATATHASAKASEPASPARAAPAPATPALTALAGNQAMQSLLRGGWVRPKLELGSSDDPEEREADAVADQVMRMPVGACCASCAGGDSCEDEAVRRRPDASAASRAPLPPGLEHQVRRVSGGGEIPARLLRAAVGA